MFYRLISKLIVKEHGQKKLGLVFGQAEIVYIEDDYVLRVRIIKIIYRNQNHRGLAKSLANTIKRGRIDTGPTVHKIVAMFVFHMLNNLYVKRVIVLQFLTLERSFYIMKIWNKKQLSINCLPFTACGGGCRATRS